MRNLKLLLNIWNTQTYTVHQISSAAVWTVLEQIIFTSWHISVGMHYSTTPPVFSMFLVRSHIGSPIPAQPHGTLEWLCFHWFLMLRSSVSRSPSHRVAGVTIVTWFSVLRRERFTWSCVSVRSSQTAAASATSWPHGEAANHEFCSAARQPIRAQPSCLIKIQILKDQCMYNRAFLYMWRLSSNSHLMVTVTKTLRTQPIMWVWGRDLLTVWQMTDECLETCLETVIIVVVVFDWIEITPCGSSIFSGDGLKRLSSCWQSNSSLSEVVSSGSSAVNCNQTFSSKLQHACYSLFEGRHLLSKTETNTSESQRDSLQG